MKYWKWMFGIATGLFVAVAIVLAVILTRTPSNTIIDESKINKSRATQIANLEISKLCDRKINNADICKTISYKDEDGRWFYYDFAYGIASEYTQDSGDYTFTVSVSEKGKVIDSSISKGGIQI